MANFNEIMSNLNGIDYVVLFILLFSMILGIKRGFAKEVVALITWIAAFVVSSLFATDVAGLFTSHSAQTSEVAGASSASLLALGVSYLLLFIGTLLCGQFVEYLVSYAIEGRGISVVNRIFGAIFGFARGWFLILLVMFVVSLTAISNQDLWKESKMVVAFTPAVHTLTDIANPYLTVLQNKMKEAGEKASKEISPEVLKATPPPPEAPKPATTPATTPAKTDSGQTPTATTPSTDKPIPNTPAP